jgi:hypothetical protein
VNKASEHAADLGDARVTSSRNKITVLVNAPWMLLHATQHRCGSLLWLSLVPCIQRVDSQKLPQKLLAGAQLRRRS